MSLIRELETKLPVDLERREENETHISPFLLYETEVLAFIARGIGLTQSVMMPKL